MLKTLRGHLKDVNACDVSADGARIVSASSDGTLKLWDGTTGEPLLTMAVQDGLWLRSAFSPDGRTIVSTNARNDTLTLWDAQYRPVAPHAQRSQG